MLLSGWVDGWREVKAVLTIDHSNKKERRYKTMKMRKKTERQKMRKHERKKSEKQEK